MARRIGIGAPPENGFAARFISIRRASAHRETEVQRKLPGSDMRIHSVPPNPPRFVLVEAQIDIGPDRIARLRAALRQRPSDVLRRSPCSQGAGRLGHFVKCARI